MLFKMFNLKFQHLQYTGAMFLRPQTRGYKVAFKLLIVEQCHNSTKTVYYVGSLLALSQLIAFSIH